MKKGLIIISMAVLALVLVIYFSCDSFENAKSDSTFSNFEVYEGTDSVRASAGATVLYVATNGTAAAAGDSANPTTIDEAIIKIATGGTIYVKAGTYYRSSLVLIADGNNGASGSTKKIFNDGTVVFDFASQSLGSNNRGFQVAGNYWHIKGITIKNAGDNGMIVQGDYNTIESCKFQANRDTGLQIARYLSSTTTANWPKGNLIKSCTSWDNLDPDNGEDADGFACKLTISTGNVFDGCYAHHNVDDGWDLYTYSDYDPIGPVKITGCTASYNGTTSSGQTFSGSDGNGFKLGGEGVAIKHTVLNCVSTNNKKDGFTWNSNPGPIYMTGCSASGNGEEQFRGVSNQ
jgi:hypothetical protein